jgi:hypothetical protein
MDAAAAARGRIGPLFDVDIVDRFCAAFMSVARCGPAEADPQKKNYLAPAGGLSDWPIAVPGLMLVGKMRLGFPPLV